MDSGRYTVYAIEATVHAPTWEGVYGEILKVLKPGGVVSTNLVIQTNVGAHLCISSVSTSGV
jgi:hypothetical protein